MNDKQTDVRNYILDLIEEGTLETGCKLPGARDVANQSGISFFVVQHAIESLVRDGILDTVPRKGTFLAEGWDRKILAENFNIFSYKHYPWFGAFKKKLDEKLPKVKVRFKFDHGMFDIRPSSMARRDHADYLDLSDCLDSLYPDKEIFITHPFKSFYMGDKLIGVPFVFSPRLIYCNQDLLRQANCDIPESNWTWSDFIGIVKKLKSTLSSEQIINWEQSTWFNFTFSAAKGIICPGEQESVKLDSDEFKDAFKYNVEIYKLLGGYTLLYHDHFKAFSQGEAAFFNSPRIGINSNASVKALPLPRMNRDCVPLQTTDVICIRKECHSMEMAKAVIQAMLSEEMQDFIATQKYRIPIRKTSAYKSLDLNSPTDTLFLNESNNMSAAYGLDSPELFNMIFYNIPAIWEQDLSIDDVTSAIADKCRGYLDVMKYKDIDYKKEQPLSE